MDERHGGFRNYLTSHDETSEAVADVRDNFKYLGQMSAYQFLYSVGVINDDRTLNKPESTEGRPWGQPLKKPAGAPLNLG